MTATTPGTDDDAQVVRLDVSVDEVSRVGVFNSRNLRVQERREETDETEPCQPSNSYELKTNELNQTHQLIGQKKNRLERELSAAEVEEIFQTRTKQIKDHGVVIALADGKQRRSKRLGRSELEPASTPESQRAHPKSPIERRLTSVPNHLTKGTPTPPARLL